MPLSDGSAGRALRDWPEPTVRLDNRDLDLAVGDAFAFAGDRCDRIVEAVLARLDARAN